MRFVLFLFNFSVFKDRPNDGISFAHPVKTLTSHFMFPNRMTGRAASTGDPVAWMRREVTVNPVFIEMQGGFLVLFKKRTGAGAYCE
jgi:hypothetical protein